jgi:hypothetical protein
LLVWVSVPCVRFHFAGPVACCTVLAACGQSGGFVVSDPPSETDGRPGFYHLVLVDARLAPRDPKGLCWSGPGCDAPNPRMVAFLDDVKVAQTEVKPGVYGAAFNESFDVRVKAWSTLDVVLESAAIGGGIIAAECRYSISSTMAQSGKGFECVENGNRCRAAISDRASLPAP